ncbi:XPG domain containing-domain-containing protein [Microdochium trichocladiopsis]|uniref:XPG domain containing-domain-containing protein n=1 Tax=Microdochium trichocladiopsis TaxID=1682393 RepID=A0A9P9BR72_9PEZI|nr:XPG domain containing-domain-containing protein [Microdochium trichocladiopsis]KAH7035623.1 XPG domain containing-domain-containing protein [Microdochium trichocladiopsis]
MGIRGLTEAIRPYGTPDVLDHSSVVIDGPALVYKILSGCLVLSPRDQTSFCQPSYALLGQLTIGWLDKLKAHDVTVRKIYFDGYLPSSKWDVRIQRLISQSEKLKKFASQQSLGVLVPSEDTFGDVVPDIALTGAKGHYSNQQLPHPAFLVPSVIHMLRQHAHWGNLVQLVPGEADDFCIADITRNGGTVLTGDSDLLVQDLGTDGYVCFFSDLAETRRDGESKLQALRFNYQELNQKLCIEDIGGLTRIAFEMDLRKAPLDIAIKFAKKDIANSAESPKFAIFKEEHTVRTLVPPDHPVLGAINTLDPRMSELVIQCQLAQAPRIIPTSGTTRGYDRLSMFLPIMMEDPCKKSSWSMSTNIRALAYSLVEGSAPCRGQPVIEYRLLSAGRRQAGREVEVFDRPQTAERCKGLCSALDSLTQMPILKEGLWFSFAVWTELQWQASEGGSPVSPLLLHRALRSKSTPERYPWDLIHFTAQVNATLYSLRMLQQALSVSRSLSPNQEAQGVQNLRKWLTGFPSIEQWPTLGTIQTLLRHLDSSGLSSIATKLGVTLEDPTKSSVNKSKKRKKSSSSVGRTGRRLPSSGSSNPFALLDQGED